MVSRCEMSKKNRRQLRFTDQECIRKCGECRHKERCGGCSIELCDARFCSKDCGNCRSVCCRSDWDGDTEPVVFDARKLDIKLPRVIWQIAGQAYGVKDEAFVLMVHRLFDYRSYPGWAKERSLAKKFKAGDGSKVGLGFCVTDPLLDELELRDDVDKAFSWDKAFSYECDFMFGPNLSQWNNFSRKDTLRLIRRKTELCKRMFDLGINVIPDVSWVTEKDVQTIAAWVKACGFKVVSFNLQTLMVSPAGKHRDRWGYELRLIADFLKFAGNPHLVVVGKQSPFSVKSMWGLTENISFCDSRAHREVDYRTLLSTFNGNPQVWRTWIEGEKKPEMEKAELFRLNIAARYSMYDAVFSGKAPQFVEVKGRMVPEGSGLKQPNLFGDKDNG